MTITLEASSPSFAALANVWQAMKINNTPYECSLVVTVPSVKSVFAWTTGVMKSGNPFPSLGRVLEPTTWAFDFQDFKRAGI